MAFDSLKKAITNNDKSKVTKLLKQSDVTKQLGNLFGEKQTTVLHESCKHGQADFVRLLLEAGADLSQEGYNGWQPIHKAAAWGQPTCVEILLKNRADVNAVTNSQSTPLHLAAEKTKLIYHLKVLKDKKYDAKAINKQYREVVRILLSNGANLEATNYIGRTPLHNSAAAGYVDIAYMLLESSADVNAKDHRGRTPQDVARDNRHYDMVEWFLEFEVQQERLLRQDVARLAASEHGKLESRLVELVEEHDAEMAEQKAQLQQAYKLDIAAHTEEIRQKLLEEMSQKETVITQLNSLVKAERQNMDNDHLGYSKYVTGLLAQVTQLREEGSAQKQSIEELTTKLEEKCGESVGLSEKVEELSCAMRSERDERAVEREEHRLEVERVTTGFKQNVLLLQQTVDTLNVDLSTQLGLNEEKENTLTVLQADFTEQSKKNSELAQQVEVIQRRAAEQEQVVEALKQEKLKENELLAAREEELAVLKKKESLMTEEQDREIERVRADWQQKLQNKELEVSDVKKSLLVLQRESESFTSQLTECETKNQAKLQALQKSLQEKDAEFESVKADAQKQMMSQEHVYNEKLQETQKEYKQKLSDLQQSLTEREKNLVVVRTQLKSQTEQIQAFERTQRESQQKHRAELQQAEEAVRQQNQTEMQVLKAELLKTQEAEVSRVRREMGEKHTSEMRRQEEQLVQRGREETGRVEAECRQRESQLQQEMFRVAGAEQAKLKEQYEARIQDILAKHGTELTALNKKVEAEGRKCAELSAQGADTRKQLESVKRQAEEEKQRHGKEVRDYREKVEGYAQQVRLKENELSSARLVHKQLEHECQRLTSTQEETARQSEERVRGAQETAQREVDGLREKLEGKESELESKVCELKQLDSVMKGYVRENTKLKDDFSARKAHMDQEILELRDRLSQTSADLEDMRGKCEGSERTLEEVRRRCEEEGRKVEERCTAQVVNAQQQLLEKDKELQDLQKQLNAINERTEDNLTRDIFTLKGDFNADHLDDSSAEQETTSEESQDICDDKEE